MSRLLPVTLISLLMLAVLACGNNSVGFIPPDGSTPTVAPPTGAGGAGAPTSTPLVSVTVGSPTQVAPSVAPEVTSTEGSTGQSPTPAVTVDPTQTPSPTVTYSGPVPDLLINNGRVLTGRGEVFTDGTVAVLNGQILFAGPTSEYTGPAGVQHINAAGTTVLPGIINAHVHDTENSSVRIDFMEAGVTSTCNTAHPSRALGDFGDPYGASVIGLGRAYNAGQFLGPPGNGYPASVFGGHLLLGVTGEAEARDAVNQLVDDGADYIKVSLEPDFDGTGNTPFPLLSQAEMNAIVDQAHQRGVIVKAHVTDGDQVAVALAAGVDSFEHIPQFPGVDLSGTSTIPFGELFSSASITGVAEMKAVIGQMVAAGVSLVPTIEVMNDEVPWTRSSPTGTVSVYQEVVEYFFKIGGRVALGTDYPLGEGGMPHNEFQLLLDSGLSNADIITASTYNAAVACGQAEHIGSLEAGKFADIIIVEGNPLTDISALGSVLRVIINGEPAA